MYNYSALEGCSYAAYDAYGNCLCEYTFSATPDEATHGGGFVVDDSMSYILFSSNAELSRTVSLAASEILSGVSSLEGLHNRLAVYNVDDKYTQDIINLYLDNKESIGGDATLDLLSAYPIGAVYLSSISVDPAKLFGGAWQQLIGIFHESIFAWTRIDADGTSAIVDIAVADMAICA